MRTSELIRILAADADPVVRSSPRGRLLRAATWGGVASLVLMVLTLKVRADVVQATLLAMFWGKLAFGLMLTAAALELVHRASIPGRTPGAMPVLLAVPPVAIWSVGILDLASAPADERVSLLLGQTWAVCPALITMLSVPFFLATIRAVRSQAPTRLRLAGAATGLFSGAAAAVVYALHCPEMAAPFIGTWYLLGIVTPAAIGWIAGPRLLRW
ncbi:MAG: DUF1109 domain-containing protein [Rubrivivax sp.]